eukprot:TRINITY_DN66648_c1_g1_i3.p1 TRINITY_DN66648_c1_g1~~TRINITY_DN66648_c1_g1_i3.p1  ORF type:complete len:478 (+),score=210.79 TRINITY_DN66648_c1_g1_i3:187-1620(+)
MLVTLTHLSDYSYLDRGIVDLAIIGWALLHVNRVDGFASIRWQHLRAFRLKTVATIMTFVSLVIMVAYDTIATIFKYDEGFYYDPDTGNIKTMPKTKYSQTNKDLLVPTDMLLNISWSLKNSAVFLLLAMYHHVARKECGRAQFASSWEFKCYSIYSIVSILLYPFLQLFFDAVSTPLMSTIMPQFVYSAECFAIVLLMILTNRRLTALVAELKQSSIVPRLNNFVRMNKFFMFSCFCDCLGLFTINVDILIDKKIAGNKFATDLMTRIFNLGFNLTYVFIIFTLYPEDSQVVRPTATHFAKSVVTCASARHSVLTVGSDSPKDRHKRHKSSKVTPSSRRPRRPQFRSNQETGVAASSTAPPVSAGAENSCGDLTAIRRNSETGGRSSVRVGSTSKLATHAHTATEAKPLVQHVLPPIQMVTSSATTSAAPHNASSIVMSESPHDDVRSDSPSSNDRRRGSDEDATAHTPGAIADTQ